MNSFSRALLCLEISASRRQRTWLVMLSTGIPVLPQSNPSSSTSYKKAYCSCMRTWISCTVWDMPLTLFCSLHHLAAPAPVARPPMAWAVWLCDPRPWRGFETDMQSDSVQEAANSPHLGLHHADSLFPQPLHAVKHIHLPLSPRHLQEEVEGDESTCAPNPCTKDTENWGSVLSWPALLQHLSSPSSVPAVHHHGSSGCFQSPLVHHLH